MIKAITPSTLRAKHRATYRVSKMAMSTLSRAELQPMVQVLFPLCHRPQATYSTVTDFARLRGWSASLPMMTAV